MSIAKYGQPAEATRRRLVWHNNGPWKFSELVNEPNAYLQRFQFDVPKGETGDRDKPFGPVGTAGQKP